MAAPLASDAPCKHYSGCGCEVSDCCLDCPLPVCKYEMSHGIQSAKAMWRTLRINHLLDEGRSVNWITQVMDVSVETVYRARRAKNTVIAPLPDTTRRGKLNVAAPSVG